MDKSEIIAEIRRTAVENGGKVLGSRRFQAESGIMESDWCGKYWARWSDACREAGFTPNTRTVRYDDAYVLEQLAIVIKSLRHWPTLAELALVRRNMPGLPSEKVFYRIGATTSQRILRVVQWCRDREKYAEVVDICRPLVEGSEQPNAQTLVDSPTDERDDRVGWVYLLRSGKFHKIGRTSHLGRRACDISRHLPEQTQLVHQIKTDDSVGVEAYWHKRFSAKRTKGEWFRLSAADVRSFRRWRWVY